MGSLSSVPNRQAPQANMNDPDYSGYTPASPIKPSSGLMGFVESIPELWASLDVQGKAKVVGLSIVGLWAVLSILGSLLSGGGRTFNNTKQMPYPNTNFAAQLTAIQLDARDLRAQVDTLQILSNDLRSMGGSGNLVERLKSLEASLDARTRSIVDEVRNAVDGRIGAYEKSTGERYSFLQSQVDELKGSINSRYDTLQRDMARMEKTYGRRLAEQGLSLKDVFAELSNLSDDVKALQVDVKGLQAPGRRYAEPAQERRPDNKPNPIASKFSSSSANVDTELPERRFPQPVQQRRPNNKQNPIFSFFGSSSARADSEPAQEPRGGQRSTDPSEVGDKPSSILSSLFGSAARRAEAPEKAEAPALPAKSKPSPKKIEDRSSRLQEESTSKNDKENVPLFEGSLWEALKASYDRVVQSPLISRVPEELPVNKVPLPEGVDAPELPVALRSTKDEVFLKTQSPPMDLDEIEENAKMYMRSMEWTSKGWDNLTLWLLIGLVTVSLWWPFALSENS
ncbi:hypothetical protein M427DRAFT_141945, partial [Gonapodya prolifera JEL478]